MVRAIGIGALIMSVFGCIWLLTGIQLLDLDNPDKWFIAAAIASLLIAAVSIGQIMAGGKGDAVVPNPEHSERLFRLANVGQWVAIAAAILIYSALGLQDWLPWTISVIVGVHFIPLSSAFHLRSYLLVAVVILLMNAGLLFFHAQQRNAYSCIGTGIILLVTATYRLIWLWKNTIYPIE